MADPITIIALVSMAVAGGASAVQQRKAGKAQQIVLNEQAKQEEIAARDAELERRERANQVLAAQIAGLGGAGISGEGSPTQIAVVEGQRRGLEDLGAATVLERRQRSLREQGKSARRLGNLRAATTILQTVGQAASIAAPTPGAAPTQKPPAAGLTGRG